APIAHAAGVAEALKLPLDCADASPTARKETNVNAKRIRFFMDRLLKMEIDDFETSSQETASLGRHFLRSPLTRLSDLPVLCLPSPLSAQRAVRRRDS